MQHSHVLRSRNSPLVYRKRAIAARSGANLLPQNSMAHRDPSHTRRPYRRKPRRNHPRVAPWAAFFRRFAAGDCRLLFHRSGSEFTSRSNCFIARTQDFTSVICFLIKRRGSLAELRSADSRWRLSPHKQSHVNLHTQATSMVSSTRRFSLSSEPVSSKEFVVAAFPFSTLVMT